MTDSKRDRLDQLVEHLYEGAYGVDCDRRIVFWNRAAQELTGYSPEEVVGRYCYDELLGHVDDSGQGMCHVNCPLAKSVEEGVSVEQRRVYLRHKDGHRVPVLVRTVPMRCENGELCGGVELFVEDFPTRVIRERMRQLEQMALVDQVTGLYNRRYMETSIQARLNELDRHGWPFGLLFCDIDHFKKLNDRFGHATGDQVLKLVSLTMRNSLRPSDVIGRWGGEEFVALLINVNPGKLKSVAERCRALVAQSNLRIESEIVQVTVSIGGTLANREDGPVSLVERADHAMYASKQAGRNRISLV